MPPFPKPNFPFDYDVPTEVAHLRAHKQKRGIPERDAEPSAGRHLEYRQLRRSRNGATRIMPCSPRSSAGSTSSPSRNAARTSAAWTMSSASCLPSYRMLMSDVAGNNERMAFLYDSQKLSLLEEVGEIAYPPSQLKNVKLPGIDLAFDGFDRSPYLAAFEAGDDLVYAGQRAPVLRR